MLFKDLIFEYRDEIETYMTWENYSLNDVIIPVTDEIKNHALMVLEKSYGMFHVEQSILNEFCSDVFTYFPVLLQQLGITRLMDAYAVVHDDINTDELVRTETLTGNVEQNSELTHGQKVTDKVEVDSNRNIVDNTTNNGTNDLTSESSTEIENTSDIESTGNRSINLTHNMPEQAIGGETGNFPTDSQGSPKLINDYVQSASENFNTNNPVNASEKSIQNITSDNHNTTSNTSTSESQAMDSEKSERTSENSGTDKSDSTTATNNINSIDEKRTQTQTNKQYAYEVKALLETVDSLIAFKNWEDRFSWVVGIV